jgi:hypothetical protein
MAGFYDRKAHLLQGGFIERRIEAGVAENLVEVVERKLILRAFVLQQVDSPEYPGNVFFDYCIRGFFDDHPNFFKARREFPRPRR